MKKNIWLLCVYSVSFLLVIFCYDTVKALDEMCDLIIKENYTPCQKLLKICFHEAVINSVFCTKNIEFKQCIDGCEHKYLPSKYNRTLKAVKLAMECYNNCHVKMGILTQHDVGVGINLCTRLSNHCK